MGKNKVKMVTEKLSSEGDILFTITREETRKEKRNVRGQKIFKKIKKSEVPSQ